MTSKQWIEKFLANKNLYCDFIKIYHPTNHVPHNLQITAPMTERVRQEICDTITNKVSQEQIEKAITSFDYEYLYGILSETWFGIPESTEMHGPAFEMLCSMLDNPVEEMS